jgi:hypothetical protein
VVEVIVMEVTAVKTAAVNAAATVPATAVTATTMTATTMTATTMTATTMTAAVLRTGAGRLKAHQQGPGEQSRRDERESHDRLLCAVQPGNVLQDTGNNELSVSMEAAAMRERSPG